MKKPHIILLVITAIMALSSAYSLAAINQIYNVKFEWYSQYYNRFNEKARDISADRWLLDRYPPTMTFSFAGSAEEARKLIYGSSACKSAACRIDFSKYIMLYCSLGKIHSPEYRIKVVKIAQRGSTVEIMVSTNSPENLKEPAEGSSFEIYPEDLVRVERSTFPEKGRLCFVFKNQEGKKLFEDYYDIK